jgi:hypothetical protein
MAANVVRQLRTHSSARTDPPRAVRPYTRLRVLIDVASEWRIGQIDKR